MMTVLKLVVPNQFQLGDLVTVISMPYSGRYCIIGFKSNERHEPVAILKALFNDTIIIERPISDLKSLLIKGIL